MDSGGLSGDVFCANSEGKKNDDKGLIIITIIPIPSPISSPTIPPHRIPTAISGASRPIECRKPNPAPIIVAHLQILLNNCILILLIFLLFLYIPHFLRKIN